MSKKIKEIYAREILDSRANPTLETKVILENGIIGRSSVPSGASTGSHEALELRDRNLKRYHGQGVIKACKNVNKIIFPVLKGMKIVEQKKIDQKMIELDGTANKSRLGANAILSVSLACAHAAANALQIPLYEYIRRTYNFRKISFRVNPMFNILNGGRHADNRLDFQEFMIIPLKTIKFKEKLRIAVEIFQELKIVLLKKGLNTNLGDEGGYAPQGIKSVKEALDLIVKAIKEAGYEPGIDVGIGLDVAANEFYDKKKKKYVLKKEGKNFTRKQLLNFYKLLIKKYPLVSIEDGLYEDDWEGWRVMNEEMGDKIQIVGDDFLVTNMERLERAIHENCANTILIKLNQIGTLTETINCIKLAQKNEWRTIISHRSGETMDTTIADLVVGADCARIKAGLARGERVCKYNRLMEIEEEMS